MRPLRVELDRTVPVLLVKIGQYPLHHGSLGAIRSLGRAGVSVYAITEDRYTPSAVSRYLSGRFIWPTTSFEPAEELYAGLRAVTDQLGARAIAMATDDEAAVFLAEQDGLSDALILPDIERPLPRTLASKRRLYELCHRLHVPVPEATFPASRADVLAYADDGRFPIIVKNVDPWTRLERPAVRSSTLVRTPDELVALAAYWPEPLNVMLQEYVPAEMAEDWMFQAYCDSASDCLAAFTGIKIRSWPPRGGVTAYARAADNREVAELSVWLCREIGYHGIGDLDWRFDRRDGRYKLLDFNPRVGVQFRLFETESGIDVVRALHLDVTGRHVPRTEQVDGRRMVVENLWAAAMLYPRDRAAVKPDLPRARGRIEFGWWAPDDPVPFVSMAIRFAAEVVGRLVRAAPRVVRSGVQRRSLSAATAELSRQAANVVLVAAADDPVKGSPITGNYGSEGVGITAQPPADGVLEPSRLLDLELSAPLPAVSQGKGGRYRRATALVRVHRTPVGLVPLELPLTSGELAQAIWAGARREITEHLRADGLREPTGLDAAGLSPPARPRCLLTRERFLAQAPAISVVVATRERVASLERCLRSLLELDYPRFEIVVVDNAPSSDATQRFVERMAPTQVPVRYVREDRPGLASAHERGLEEVDSELVAFTDDDVVVDRDWLTAIAEAFRDGEDVGCVTGLILPTELETPAQIWLERHARLNKGFDRMVFRRDSDDRDPLFPYAAGRFGSGASMAFKVAALRVVGGFDAAIGVGTPARGGDDLLAFFRIVDAGYALVYEPRAVLWHAYRGELARLRRQMFDYGAGLTAYLTGLVLDNPRVALDMLPRVPRGIRYALSSRSPRNPRSHVSFERELIWAERLGMSYGPLGYLLSKRRIRA